jgi:ribokinase
MMKEWDIVVVGGANYDYLVRGTDLPGPGDTIDGDELQEGPGGKGANQAIAAARLGAKVALVARIGNDERGERVLDHLTAEGVDTTSVFRSSQIQTGVALVHVTKAGQKQIMVAPGANHALRVADITQSMPLIETAGVLLTQLEIPQSTVEIAVRQAHARGVPVVLDPAPARTIPDELLRLVDVVKPNAGEAKVLTGVDVTDRTSARAAAHTLLAKGLKIVAIQAGDDGNLLVWPDDELWLPHIDVDSIDATGAGDAFAAALSVALAEGWPLPKAGPFANAAAALTTTKVGAQPALPRRQAVLDLVEQGLA